MCPLRNLLVSWSKKQLCPFSLYMVVEGACIPEEFSWGHELDRSSWTNSKFFSSSASFIKSMAPAWSAAMLFNLLMEFVDGSLAPSVPFGTVSDLMVAGWFELDVLIPA